MGRDVTNVNTTQDKKHKVMKFPDPSRLYVQYNTPKHSNFSEHEKNKQLPTHRLDL